MRFLSLTMLLLVFSLLTACQGDDEKTFAEIISSSPWRLTSYAEADDQGAFKEVITSCEKDDVWDFKTGGVLTLQYGPEKCDDTEPASENGSWALTQNDTRILITQGIGFEANILELTENNFLLQLINPLSPNTTGDRLMLRR
jgi:Lipocalin-like domain